MLYLCCGLLGNNKCYAHRLTRMENAVARSLLYIRAVQQSRDTERDTHRVCQQASRTQMQTLQSQVDDKDRQIRHLSMVWGRAPWQTFSQHWQINYAKLSPCALTIGRFSSKISRPLAFARGRS